MDAKIKNLKAKKKKKTEKKTIPERLFWLNAAQKKAFETAMEFCDPKEYNFQSGCCLGFNLREVGSFWPIPYKDQKSKEST